MRSAPSPVLQLWEEQLSQPLPTRLSPRTKRRRPRVTPPSLPQVARSRSPARWGIVSNFALARVCSSRGAPRRFLGVGSRGSAGRAFAAGDAGCSYAARPFLRSPQRRAIRGSLPRPLSSASTTRQMPRATAGAARSKRESTSSRLTKASPRNVDMRISRPSSRQSLRTRLRSNASGRAWGDPTS